MQILSLDHWIISKFSNPQMNETWCNFFMTIYKLIHKKKIICVGSEYNIKEISLSEDIHKIKDRKCILDLLFRNNFFIERDLICIEQIQKKFQSYLLDNFNLQIEVDELNVIQDYKTLYDSIKDDLPTQQYLKENIHKELNAINVPRWKREKHKSFNDWYNEESKSFGINIIAQYIEGKKRPLIKEKELLYYKVVLSLYKMIDNIEVKLDVFDIIFKFIQSDEFADCDFNRIKSALFALHASQFAHDGRQSEIDQGEYYDIQFISTLLPYCDIMFVDSRAKGMLIDGNFKKKYPHNTKIYSEKDIPAFICEYS